jgi:ERCC4-related helicase
VQTIFWVTCPVTALCDILDLYNDIITKFYLVHTYHYVSYTGFFLNILPKDWTKWKDFSLVVIDEVHHCTKKHAFNTLMQENHLQLNRETRPKLLGMTASPAGEANVPLTQEMLQRLLENIGMAKLTIVEDHEKQLGEFQTRTVLEIDLVKMSDDETQLEDDIQMYLLHIFNFLVKTTNLGSLCKELGLNTQEGPRAMVNAMEFAGEGLEAFRYSLGMIEVKDRCKNMARFIKKIIMHADAVCGALLGLRLCGEEAVYHSLRPLADDVISCRFDEMAKIGFSCQPLQSRTDTYEENIDGRRKKMTAFWRLVDRIVTQVEWNNVEEKKPIVMVIVRERKVAKLLATLLQSNIHVQEQGLNVEFIVGHGDGDVGMSASRQRKLLEETWQHRYQVGDSTFPLPNMVKNENDRTHGVLSTSLAPGLVLLKI